MPKDEQLITAEILSYIRSFHGSVSDWFVASAESGSYSLFEYHNVNKDEDRWIFRKAFSVEAAHRIAEYFRRDFGTDGDPTEGGESPHFVIAYRKSGHTIP